MITDSTPSHSAPRTVCDPAPPRHLHHARSTLPPHHPREPPLYSSHHHHEHGHCRQSFTAQKPKPSKLSTSSRAPSSRLPLTIAKSSTDWAASAKKGDDAARALRPEHVIRSGDDRLKLALVTDTCELRIWGFSYQHVTLPWRRRGRLFVTSTSATAQSTRTDHWTPNKSPTRVRISSSASASQT